ncbi:hypothetical protein D3C80_2073760 [compost metagenome]
MEGTSHIIAAGAGLTGKQALQLQEQVFAEGVSEVAPQVIAYVAALFNPGGARKGAESKSGNARADAAP